MSNFEDTGYLSQQSKLEASSRNPMFTKTVGSGAGSMMSNQTTSRRPELDAILANNPNSISQQNWIIDNLNAFTSPKKVTAKALVSHYYGFGNINVDKINASPKGKTTGHEGSGKFSQKLQQKQKMIEAQMLENRLRKLHNEEQRLQKQIRIAQKHSEFADQVKSRRDEDNDMMSMHKRDMLEQEERQRQLNYERRMNNLQGINAHKNHVLATNAHSRAQAKAQSQDNVNERFRQKMDEQEKRNSNANFGLAGRRQAKANADYRQQSYNAAVAQAHQQKAVEHARIKEANEMRIRQLEEMEQRMVSDLQRTLQVKNQVMNDLASKSKGLKKVMQPRLAYKYGQRETSTSDLINMQAQSQYAFSTRKVSDGRLGNTQTMKGFNQRSKSIVGGKNPAAAPSSGNNGLMFNDVSSKQIADDDMVAAAHTIKSAGGDEGNEAAPAQQQQQPPSEAAGEGTQGLDTEQKEQ